MLEKVRDIQDVYPTELILKSPSVSMVRAGLNMIYNTSATWSIFIVVIFPYVKLLLIYRRMVEVKIGSPWLANTFIKLTCLSHMA